MLPAWRKRVCGRVEDGLRLSFAVPALLQRILRYLQYFAVLER